MQLQKTKPYQPKVYPVKAALMSCGVFSIFSKRLYYTEAKKMRCQIRLKCPFYSLTWGVYEENIVLHRLQLSSVLVHPQLSPSTKQLNPVESSQAPMLRPDSLSTSELVRHAQSPSLAWRGALTYSIKVLPQSLGRPIHAECLKDKCMSKSFSDTCV